MARIKIFDTNTQSWVYADKTFSKIPVKGVDYYTEEEKAEFESFIANELAKRGQLEPVFANSIKDCTDTSKMYVLPDGYIYAFTKDGGYTNLVPSAEERIISGDALTGYDGVGYANNYRLSSSGVIKTAQNAIATGFIPASAGDTIRIGGIQWCLIGCSWNYVCAYKSDYSYIGSVYGSEAGYYGTKIHASCTIDYDVPLTTIGLTNNADIAFIRVSCYNESLQDGSKLIVTVNEEIV